MNLLFGPSSSLASTFYDLSASIDVSELHEICGHTDYEALSLLNVRSGKKKVTVRSQVIVFATTLYSSILEIKR